MNRSITILFICAVVVVILTTVALAAFLATSTSKRKRRDHDQNAPVDLESNGTDLEHEHTFEQFKLKLKRGYQYLIRSTLLMFPRSQSTNMDSNLTSTSHTPICKPPRSLAKHSDRYAASRLSRPTHHAIRLSILRTHSPDTRPTYAHTRSNDSTRNSLVSAISDRNRPPDERAISPVSPVASEVHIPAPPTFPARTYQVRDRSKDRIQVRSTGGVQVQRGVSFSEADLSGALPSPVQGLGREDENHQRKEAREMGQWRFHHRKYVHEDHEWRVTRTEMVDGVLAPREWV